MIFGFFKFNLIYLRNSNFQIFDVLILKLNIIEKKKMKKMGIWKNEIILRKKSKKH